MKPLSKLKELILEKVPLSEVLKDYNVEFMYDPDLADEVQFKCPIHGKDNKPSARFYKSTQSCYCWVCHKRWDTIGFIEDKENLNFIGAIKYILDKYKLDTSGLPDIDLKPSRPKTPDDMEMQKMQENSFVISLRAKIRQHKGKIPLEKYVVLCSAYYMILFERFKGHNSMPSIRKFGSKLDRIVYGK